MGKIDVKLKDKYPNQFITTITGYAIKRNEWTEVEEYDIEISQLLKDNTTLDVKGEDSLKSKIILDMPSTKTIKEVVSKEAMKQNEEVLKNDNSKLSTINNKIWELWKVYSSVFKITNNPKYNSI